MIIELDCSCLVAADFLLAEVSYSFALRRSDGLPPGSLRRTRAGAELCSALWWWQNLSNTFLSLFYSTAQVLGSPKLGAGMDNCALSLFQKGLPLAWLQFLFLFAPSWMSGPMPNREKKECENERRAWGSGDFPGSLSSECFPLCPNHTQKMCNSRKKRGLGQRSMNKQNNCRLLRVVALRVAAVVEIHILPHCHSETSSSWLLSPCHAHLQVIAERVLWQPPVPVISQDCFW